MYDELEPTPKTPSDLDCMSIFSLGCLIVFLGGIGAFAGCTVGLPIALEDKNSWALPVALGIGIVGGIGRAVVVWRGLKSPWR